MILWSTSIYVSAQEGQPEKIYEPQFGEAGKDARWEPTPQIVVEKMLDIANVTSNDFVIDLGSGDGRIVINAAKRDARARGIEYNADMVELSRVTAEKEGLSGKTEFIQGDLYEADLSEATVITMYLLPRINLKLRPALFELKPGTRIVSNSHTMGDWIPDEAALKIKDNDSFWNIYSWIIPARVEGTWKIPKGELKLEQEFQMVSGILKSGKNSLTIQDGRLKGDELTFIADGEVYFGEVMGSTIDGTVTSGQKTRKWHAKLKNK